MHTYTRHKNHAPLACVDISAAVREGLGLNRRAIKGDDSHAVLLKAHGHVHQGRSIDQAHAGCAAGLDGDLCTLLLAALAVADCREKEER